MLNGAALDPKTYQIHVINKISLRRMLLIYIITINLVVVERIKINLLKFIHF